MKSYLVRLSCALIATCGLATGAQAALIHSESFETDGNGTRYVASQPFLKSGLPYQHWQRINPATNSTSNTSGAYTGHDGSFLWSAEDTDYFLGDGEETQTLTISGIDISGFTSLSFSGLFGAGNTGGAYDSDDGISVHYTIDGNPETLGLAFWGHTNNDGPLAQDANLDGVADGVQLTPQLGEFGFSLPDGNSLTLRISVKGQASSEELAFDNLRIQGEPVVITAAPEPSSLALAGLVAGSLGLASRRRRR